jgi:hypothetical protein
MGNFMDGVEKIKNFFTPSFKSFIKNKSIMFSSYITILFSFLSLVLVLGLLLLFFIFSKPKYEL